LGFISVFEGELSTPIGSKVFPKKTANHRERNCRKFCGMCRSKRRNGGEVPATASGSRPAGAPSKELGREFTVRGFCSPRKTDPGDGCRSWIGERGASKIGKTIRRDGRSGKPVGGTEKRLPDRFVSKLDYELGCRDERGEATTGSALRKGEQSAGKDRFMEKSPDRPVTAFRGSVSYPRRLRQTFDGREGRSLVWCNFPWPP